MYGKTSWTKQLCTWNASLVVKLDIGAWRFRKIEGRVGWYGGTPVFNSDANSLCFYQHAALGAGVTVMYQCPQPSQGRYVTIQKNLRDTFHLCELRVMAIRM